jgi:hypothetical protein
LLTALFASPLEVV